jgi:hypothetical protein
MIIDGTKRKEEEIAQGGGTLIGGQQQTFAGGTGATSTNAAQNVNKPTNSGFTNLNQYINKNQGTSNQTANKISGEADRQYGGIQTKIGEANKVGTGALTTINNFKSNQDTIKQNLSAPRNITEFKTAVTGLNTDPNKGIEEFDSATAQAEAARKSTAANLANLGTGGGISEYLRTQRSSPRYSQGSQSLDKFLIQGTDEGQKAVTNVQARATSLGQTPTDFTNLKSKLTDAKSSLDTKFMTPAQVKAETAAILGKKRDDMTAFQNNQNVDYIGKGNSTTGVQLAGMGGSPIDRGDPGRGLREYLAENDTSARVARFTPEQIVDYATFAAMNDEDPAEFFRQNEQAYIDRAKKTEGFRDSYVQGQETRAQEVAAAREAERVEAARAAKAREEQLALLALYFTGAMPASVYGGYLGTG